jgi:RNA polymerase sigma factor (sigma-70 family)
MAWCVAVVCPVAAPVGGTIHPSLVICQLDCLVAARAATSRTVPASSEDISDGDLWVRCQSGSQAAWSLLVRRYQRLVYTVPRRAGLPDELCADVFQTAFSRLYEHLDRLDDPSRIRAWLVTTAKRESLRQLDLIRRRAEVTAVATDDGVDDPLSSVADESPLAEDALEAIQMHDLLRRALDRLDEKSRKFAELVFLQDEPLPYQEVAARLGIAEGSIGPTRARVLAKIRALMGDL